MIASTLLDQLIGALRHHERRPADQYRLVRPSDRYYDAWYWVSKRPVSWASAAERRRTLERWIWLRRRHHVAWLERGGTS